LKTVTVQFRRQNGCRGSRLDVAIGNLDSARGWKQPFSQPAWSVRRHPGADPTGASRQPSLGLAADPRRAAEAGHRGVTDDGGEVLGASRRSPGADVAHLPH